MHILIDTNVVFGLEDNTPIKVTFARFFRLCSLYGIRLFISDATFRDIENDRDEGRRRATLSKLEKYQRLGPVPSRFLDEVSADLPPDSRRNSTIDSHFLAALTANAVDFLVTQDDGIHRRASRSGIVDRVLFVPDAIRIIEKKFEPNTVKLPYISHKKAYELDIRAEIFDSLREGYPEFDDWFVEKCQRAQRDCWVIEVDEEIVGIVIYKVESSGATDALSTGSKFLKLCTFKMSPSYRGERFGEQLLKQALWHAASNAFDVIYVTAFEDQAVLINLLNHFGFRITYRNKRGEFVLEKSISKDVNKPKDMLPLEATLINYPRYYHGNENSKFAVPIQGDYFDRLFPENDGKRQGELFRPGELSTPMLNQKRIPGNTIRKVYVCRSNSERVRPGDVIVFYKSQREGDDHSQCATTLGVVEGYSEAVTRDELVKMTSKRSVFSDEFLGDMFNDNTSPVKVLDFLLIGHFQTPIPLRRLIDFGAVKSAPQSIAHIPDEAFECIIQAGHLKP